MKKSWTEYLPTAIYKLLSRMKALYTQAVIHMLYPFFARMPIHPNKIVLDNYRGRGYGCNPKYIAQKLIEKGTDEYDLVWLVSDRYMDLTGFPPQIRIVWYGSLKCFYEYATAKIWISNYPKMYLAKNGVRKRQGQFFIQTCHGSLGIKKIDGDVSAFTGDRRWLQAAIASSNMTDYWISNSSFENNVYKSAFWNVKDEAVLLYGHPRNDIFFDAASMRRARRKVEDAYGIQEKRLLLYAPTFRDDFRVDCYKDDFADLLLHLRKRFGGNWMILMRMHPRVRKLATNLVPHDASVVNVTEYMDMQELLAAADCLLTDYSSCVFDFMLTRRPAFLFVPDIQEYNTERGFYYPIETTPFPLARSNDELLDNVSAFDEETYRLKIEAFLRDKGCMEDGHASERVADMIERLMKENTA